MEHGLSGQSRIFLTCSLEEETKYEFFNLHEPRLSCGVLAGEMLKNANKTDLTQFLDYLTNAFAKLINIKGNKNKTDLTEFLDYLTNTFAKLINIKSNKNKDRETLHAVTNQEKKDVNLEQHEEAFM